MLIVVLVLLVVVVLWLLVIRSMHPDDRWPRNEAGEATGLMPGEGEGGDAE